MLHYLSLLLFLSRLSLASFTCTREATLEIFLLPGKSKLGNGIIHLAYVFLVLEISKFSLQMRSVKQALTLSVLKQVKHDGLLAFFLW